MDTPDIKTKGVSKGCYTASMVYVRSAITMSPARQKNDLRAWPLGRWCWGCEWEQIFREKATQTESKIDTLAIYKDANCKHNNAKYNWSSGILWRWILFPSYIVTSKGKENKYEAKAGCFYKNIYKVEGTEKTYFDFRKDPINIADELM